MKKILMMAALLLLQLIAVPGAFAAPQRAKDAKSLPIEGKTKWDLHLPALIMNSRSASGLQESSLDAFPDPGLSPLREIRRATATGANIQGHLKASSSPDFPNGWYEVDPVGNADLLYSSTALMGSCGFVRNDRICQFTTISSYGYFWFYYSEYDRATGEELFEIELPDSEIRNYIINCAYDATEDRVYVQCYSRGGTSMGWWKFNPEDRSAEYINNDLNWSQNRVVASGWNPRDGKVYGITEDARFVMLEKSTGKAQTVAQLPVEIMTYSQAMTFSPLDHAFLWAPMYSDNTSGFAFIDPADGSFSAAGMMPAQNEFVQLYCSDPDYGTAAPGIPNDLAASFVRNNLSGTLSATAPASFTGGDPIPASAGVRLHFVIDGGQPETRDCTPGERVQIPATLAQGMHNLKVYATNPNINNGVGPTRELDFYVGYDNPAMPTDVSISSNRISWTAPTTGAHDGYLDQADLKYNVWLGQTLLTPTPVKATSVTFTTPTSLGIYVARVEAISQGLTSEPGLSQGVKYGEIFDMPFHFIPSQQEFDLCTVVDANHDGITWKIYAEREKFYCQTPNQGTNDDWLFFPAANFTSEENLYLISMNLQALLQSCPENMDIWLCSAADPASKLVKVAEFTDYNKDVWTRENVKFAIQDAGQYFIGFHDRSTHGFLLNLQDVTVSQTTDTRRAPADIKGVEIIGGAQGALNATLKFFAPVKDLAGGNLDPNEEITVWAETLAGKASVKVLPGTTGELVFPTLQGTNTVRVTPQNSGGYGIERTYQVFTGVEKPGPVTNVNTNISEDGLTLTLTWEPPTIGENGGYIDPSKVRYQAYTAGDEMWIFLEDLGDRKSYSWTVPAGTQSLQQIAIAGYNEAGTASVSNFKGAARIMGTPYELPYVETFNWGVPDHLPILVTKPSPQHTAEWLLGDPTAIIYGALTPDYGAMYCHPTVPGETMGRVEIPLISTKDYNYATFRARLYHMPMGGIFRVLAKKAGEKYYTTVGEVDCAVGQPGYVEENFQLPAEFQNQPWVAFAIECEFNASSTDRYVIIDSFQLLDLPDNDMMVCDMVVPYGVKAGEQAEFQAMALNHGRHTQLADGLWEVLHEDQVLASNSVRVSPLDPDEDEIFSWSYTPDSKYAGQKLTVRFSVSANPDDAPANDRMELQMFVRSDGLPRVTDLTAEAQPEGIRLDWSVPALCALSSEDFEAMEDGDYSEELGLWRNLDIDGKEIVGIANSTIIDAGEPKGWQVLDTATCGLPGFQAASGSKFLLALAPRDESAANDWLISPEVAPGSVVEITANILSSSFPEEFEILYGSASASEPDDFTPLASVTKDTYGWEIFSVALPRTAGRFAIRYNAVNQFGMMLDDIAYTPAEGTMQTIAAYRVYRDGLFVHEQAPQGTLGTEPQSWTDAECDLTSEHAYQITTLTGSGSDAKEGGYSNKVYAGGESGLRNLSDFSQRIVPVENGVILAGLAGKNFVVAAADGKTIARGTADSDNLFISLGQGVYAVSAGNIKRTVIIR